MLAQPIEWRLQEAEEPREASSVPRRQHGDELFLRGMAVLPAQQPLVVGEDVSPPPVQVDERLQLGKVLRPKPVDLRAHARVVRERNASMASSDVRSSIASVGIRTSNSRSSSRASSSWRSESQPCSSPVRALSGTALGSISSTCATTPFRRLRMRGLQVDPWRWQKPLVAERQCEQALARFAEAAVCVE